MSANLQYALFAVVAASVLVPALLVVTSRNLVRAGFWLLPVFLGVAAAFVLLGADFLAAVQVLIYAGAITVLLIFVLMLTRGAGNPQVRQSNRMIPWALLLSGAVGVLTAFVLGREFWPVTTETPVPGFTRALGEGLLTTWLFSFELASVLLLAAMVGAIVIARREEP